MSHTEGAESRVSRQAKKERKQRNLLSKIVLVVLAVVACIGLAVFTPSDSAQFNLQEVQTVIQELYLDEKQDYLNPDVTQVMIEEAINELETLGVKATDAVYLKVQEAQDKYLAIEALNQVYMTDEAVIEGETVQADLKLQEDVTLASLEALGDEYPLAAEGELGAALNQLYKQATQVLEEVSQLETLVSNLPQEVSEEANLTGVLPQLVEVETELGRLGERASIESLQVDFEQKVSKLAELLKTQAETTEFSDDMVAMMFKCQTLASNLSGSILDSRKLVSFTFDDGPNPLYTQQVLDILDKYDVKGTFFLLGQEVERYPELAKQIVEDGHVLANHSFGHPNFSEISDEEVLKEINRTQEAIFDATGVTPTMYRMPYGAGGARVVNLFPELESVIWNVDSEDWISDDAYAIYANVMENMLPHTVILMHDKHQSTVDSLELLIPDLINQGYEFVDPLEVGMEFLYYE